MMGGHGVSQKPCSEVNYAFRKRKGVNILNNVHSLRNILRSQVVGRPRIYRWSL